MTYTLKLDDVGYIFDIRKYDNIVQILIKDNTKTAIINYDIDSFNEFYLKQLVQNKLDFITFDQVNHDIKVSYILSNKYEVEKFIIKANNFLSYIQNS